MHVPSPERAQGALYGLGIGDALGMPTQMLSRRQIVERWGPLLTGFEAAPHDHPIAAGMPGGSVTDDTEQAALLGWLLVGGNGRVAPGEVAAALLGWEREMAARGSLDLLGPSTKRALDAVANGTPPAEAGKHGDTNGAAMRITPVGIVAAADNLPALVDRVQQASIATHNTSVALAGAAAVAAAVSAGIDGADVGAATETAIAAAELGAQRGHWTAGADVAARIRWAAGLVAGAEPQRAAEVIYTLVGTSLATQESVPAAFAVLSAVPGDPWQACLLAASLGGDCDTIAAMAGAIGGACHGLAAFPTSAIETVDKTELRIDALAEGALRAAQPAMTPTDPAAARPRRLVFAGEALVDVLMRVPSLPPRGGDMLATSSQVAVGGGFNVMAAAARQGMPVLYAGGHGTGPWGELVRGALAAEGIGLLRPPEKSRDTGFDVALVESDAERTFVTSLGAESISAPGSWDTVPAGPGDAVYVSGYGLVPPGSGAVLGAWAAALPPGALLFVDPGPLAAQIPDAVLGPVLARCDWLSCNAREAAILGGAADPEEAARRLLGRTARASVIVRVGPAGCFLATRPLPAPVSIPAPAMAAVDTTGAGDAHSGVFLAALADGLSPADAARRANTAAAFAVTRPGPATSPARAELDAWLARWDGLRAPVPA